MVRMYQRLVLESNSNWKVSWSDISSWLAVTSTPATGNLEWERVGVVHHMSILGIISALVHVVYRSTLLKHILLYTSEVHRMRQQTRKRISPSSFLISYSSLLHYNTIQQTYFHPRHIVPLIATVHINSKYHVFAPMGRFQLELIYLYFPPSSHLIYVCFCPVGLLLFNKSCGCWSCICLLAWTVDSWSLNLWFCNCWSLKFGIFVCCLAWLLILEFKLLCGYKFVYWVILSCDDIIE